MSFYRIIGFRLRVLREALFVVLHEAFFIKEKPLKALVLFSGGLDSSVCLGLAVKAYGPDEVLALSIYYGQKHKKEMEASEKVAAFYGVQRVTLDLGEQRRRPAGNTMVVYDKNRDSYGYNQTIPTAVDNFTINLMKKNAAGQYVVGQVVDSCDFKIHFTFTLIAIFPISIFHNK